MPNLISKARDYKMSRRSFLGWAAMATGGATAALSLSGCSLTQSQPTLTAGPSTEQGRWVTASCWHNCGGRCLNKAYVVDGVVLKQKTDDTHPDSPDFPQQRACVRGRAQRQQVFGADRIKYPMKRKNWEPGGGKKELRGNDEWVRITWDEALDLVAEEIKRIHGQYGSTSILAMGSEMQRMFNQMGGFVSQWGSTSYGTWLDTGPLIGRASGGCINDRFDLRNSQLIIMWGVNPAWSSMGNPTYNFLQAKKAGAKMIFIDPLYNDTARVMADEWVPCRPATDTALCLGMIHTLLEEDKPSNPLIKWDFIHKYSVGFDADHMPEGVDPKENFKDYVLGVTDGVPKSAEWASKICGVSANKIRSLAREIARTERVALLSGWAVARVNNADTWPQAFLTLGVMTGHIGTSGNMCGVSSHSGTGNQNIRLISTGSNGVPRGTPNPIADVRINYNELWDAVLRGKYTAGYKDIRDINIQMIYHGGVASRLNQVVGIPKGIEAHRKVEFVVSHHYVLNSSSKYADIVLPITTQWERWGGLLSGNAEILIFAQQVVEPLFEAKDDVWVAVELGKRLGLDAKETAPLPLKQMVFNQIAGTTVMKMDKSDYEPLITITAEDIKMLGVEGKPQQGRITYKQFQEDGIYQFPRKEGDNFYYIHDEDFIKDPDKNPLKTESGKYEIYCRANAEMVKSRGWTEITPIPSYTKIYEGYEDTFSDWDKQIKGEYPFQLYTIHYRRRSHSVLDNLPWLREAFPQEFCMNDDDAAKLELKKGDIVKITSRHGSVIRPLHTTPRMMPGVVYLGEGAWVDMDEEAGVDKAGATNMLNGDIPTGQGHQGWNSCNVKIEKWNKPLQADHHWKQRVIF